MIPDTGGLISGRDEAQPEAEAPLPVEERPALYHKATPASIESALFYTSD